MAECVCVLYKCQAEELPSDGPAVTHKETSQQIGYVFELSSATRRQPGLLLRIRFDIIQFGMRIRKQTTMCSILMRILCSVCLTHTASQESFIKSSGKNNKNKRPSQTACQIMLQIVEH